VVFVLAKPLSESARLNHLSYLQFSESQVSCGLPKLGMLLCQAALAASQDGNVMPQMRRQQGWARHRLQEQQDHVQSLERKVLVKQLRRKKLVTLQKYANTHF